VLVADYRDRESDDVSFGFTPEGERTVRVDAMRVMPTMLMPVLGVDSLNIRSSAIAAIPPVDLILLLDTSGSLGDMGAFDEQQSASKTFVDQFDEDLDQVGLVSFQLRAASRFGLGKNFKSSVKGQIDGLRSAGDTNMGEGLRIAHAELTSGAERERSAKVVVFFTDGRATGFRGDILGVDRMMAVGRTSKSNLRGYFDLPDLLPLNTAATATFCGGSSNCFGWTPASVRQRSKDYGAEQAEALRADGIVVYSIGLGNPKAGDPFEVPDLDYLREIANEDGATNSRQPRGKAYFAPSEAELEDVFRQVATDLLVRLAQ
jgi:hypothetical protein